VGQVICQWRDSWRVPVEGLYVGAKVRAEPLPPPLCDALGAEFGERHRNAVRVEVADMFAEIMDMFEATFSKDKD